MQDYGADEIYMGEAAEMDGVKNGACRMRRAAFITFGCRLNKAEALDIESWYAADGWQVASIGDDSGAMGCGKQEPAPDVIIVRGCSVTAKAQRDCEKAIARLRARFPEADIRITGCLPQGLKRGQRGADAAGTNKDAPQPPSDDSSLHALPPPNHRLSRAYLKVQDGCSGKCTFCIVPHFRGMPKSVPYKHVIDRARAFLANGFSEIILTGCNLCLYRSDGHGLPELAAELASLESSGHRIRIGSIEPGICDARLIDAMEAHPKICRFLHMSVQSGSDRILRLMRRPYTAEQVSALCAEAKRRLGPRLALGADIIAGFPGETDDDHKSTQELIRSANFVHTHVFPYSERPGTEAATMAHPVPPAARRARAKELERTGKANLCSFAQSLIGKTVEVCVEQDGTGRTDEHIRCIFDGSAPRRSLAHATVKKYFPKNGTLSATICGKE